MDLYECSDVKNRGVLFIFELILVLSKNRTLSCVIAC